MKSFYKENLSSNIRRRRLKAKVKDFFGMVPK